MAKSTILCGDRFTKEFERCCCSYETLRIATAWCGDPSHALPYDFLTANNHLRETGIIMGIALNQSHPKSIEYFIDHGLDIRIFRPNVAFFHPKVYLFRSRDRAALFVGSSNFTYSGFFDNVEMNILTEGALTGEFKREIDKMEQLALKWHSDEYSFVPDSIWLKVYASDYEKQRAKERNSKIPTTSGHEAEISSTSWLSKADWPVYFQRVIADLKKNGRTVRGYHDVLDAAKKYLPLPWQRSYFDDIEKRRIIGGMEPYGWLGHVAASGAFRKFMANGTVNKQQAAINALNRICAQESPLNFTLLRSELDKLITLGHSIKVWSRLLTIARPDTFCTVASPSVRKALATTLGVTQYRLELPEGYVDLLRMIHDSPWYMSSKPSKQEEQQIWKRRAAFMDAIFY